MPDFEQTKRETEAYLARIRRTIAESTALVESAELRLRETDRLLESQGLTREQVLGMRFTDAQRADVNRELARLGLEPLEEEPVQDAGRETGDTDGEFRAHDDSPVSRFASRAPEAEASLSDRQKKFSSMMKPFRI